MPKLPLLFCALAAIFPSNCLAAPVFDPASIVTDTYFTDGSTMDAAHIQTFLEQHGSILASAPPALLGAGANGRSAAKIIYDSSQGQAPRINPQVILATLQKEQSLITKSSASSSALNKAAGYGCPDSGGCSLKYSGFANQVANATAQFSRNFLGAYQSAFPPGKNKTLRNELGAPEYPLHQQDVLIGNAATSALYQYTPHVYYGNKHFWEVTQNWFGTEAPYLAQSIGTPVYYVTSGARHRLAGSWTYSLLPSLSLKTVRRLPIAQLRLITNGPAIGLPSRASTGGFAYLVTGGKKWRFPTDIMLSNWGFSNTSIETVDPSLLSSVPDGGTVSLLQRSSPTSLITAVISGKRYAASSQTLTAWGLQGTSPLMGGPEMDFMFPLGGLLSQCVPQTRFFAYLMLSGNRYTVPASMCMPLMPVGLPTELLPPAH